MWSQAWTLVCPEVHSLPDAPRARFQALWEHFDEVRSWLGAQAGSGVALCAISITCTHTKYKKQNLNCQSKDWVKRELAIGNEYRKGRPTICCCIWLQCGHCQCTRHLPNLHNHCTRMNEPQPKRCVLPRSCHISLHLHLYNPNTPHASMHTSPLFWW